MLRRAGVATCVPAITPRPPVRGLLQRQKFPQEGLQHALALGLDAARGVPRAVSVVLGAADGVAAGAGDVDAARLAVALWRHRRAKVKGAWVRCTHNTTRH